MDLVDRFRRNGQSIFLVGGSVRDALLNRPAEDLDFTTDARPDRIEEILSGWADTVFRQGTEFGTVGLVKDGHQYEITTFRSEIYRSDSRKPVVRFSETIEEDLSRRDFTVNAMALSLPDFELLDPHGGLEDLARHWLSTPLDPKVSFSDDPLRMLRLFRFVSTLGFKPDPIAVAATEDMTGRLDIVSGERIREELCRLLMGEKVEEGLWGVVKSGLAEIFLPEFPAMSMEQDPHHKHKDVLGHTIAVVGQSPPRLRVRLAALFHDIGKPLTRRYASGGVTFHHHEVVGEGMTKERMKALKFPRDMIRDVSKLVFLHLRPHTFKYGWTDSAVRRYVRDAGHLLEDLNDLVRADVTTANPGRRKRIYAGLDAMEERIAELSAKEELDKLRPPIDGNQLMAYLGLDPGPKVGKLLKKLLEKRIDEGPYSELEAFTLVRELVVEWGDPDPGPPPVEDHPVDGGGEVDISAGEPVSVDDKADDQAEDDPIDDLTLDDKGEPEAPQIGEADGRANSHTGAGIEKS